jgi:hypothetical protein
MADKRNHPCTCGSGKRYKKCCGLTGGNPAVSEDLAELENATGAPSAAAFFQREWQPWVRSNLRRQPIIFSQAMMDVLIAKGLITEEEVLDRVEVIKKESGFELS